MAFEELSVEDKNTYMLFCKDFFWPKETTVIKSGEQLEITDSSFIISQKGQAEEQGRTTEIEKMDNSQRFYILGYMMAKYKQVVENEEK